VLKVASSIVTGKTQIACWTSCVNWDDKCLLLQVQLFEFYKYHPNCCLQQAGEASSRN
jgi:hypothetical protein